jgi:hypothetical protein
MGTYNVPRNVKGEGRILFIFSTKALIYSGIGALIGGIFYIIFNLLGLTLVGIAVVVVFALIGFVIGTFKVPNIERFEFSRKTGGENIDDVIKRAVKFKMKKEKLYVYTKEEKKDE